MIGEAKLYLQSTQHICQPFTHTVRFYIFSDNISVILLGCSLTCFPSTFSFSFLSALWPPPWLPKQCPRFHSASKHHGILFFIPAELPVLSSDPPLLRLPATPKPAEDSAPPHCATSASAKAEAFLVRLPFIYYVIPT